MSAQEVKVRTWCFNFQKQFAPKVEAREKRQTIRARRKDGRVPRPGDRVKLYTGLRTRGARLLCEGIVSACFPVQIDDDPMPIIAAGVRLNRSSANDFAEMDGFPHATAMVEWFRKTHGADFEGFCVRWRAEE